MFASPHWFLYAGYEPPDRTKFFSVVSLAYALGLRHRSLATKRLQHGRIGIWHRRRVVKTHDLPN
ncbi:hypothetical protein [Pandoraea anhela]|uniref:Uncharacterized protein n=1 Tax=Pandoraea anhela TaxID=2508295 RepID=A0A5E4W5V5_9BURK|nr:hypothetical protein [Pandoraea anhela]VVE19006.1 hypothetical protein PAN31108_03024 [Pandoraea anhela]